VADFFIALLGRLAGQLARSTRSELVALTNLHALMDTEEIDTQMNAALCQSNKYLKNLK